MEEYKNFDIDAFKHEIMNEFDQEVNNKIRVAEANHKAEGEKEIDKYDRLHDEHQSLQKENLEAGEDRKGTLTKIQNENNELDAFAQNAIREKSSLRDNIADLEDTLRRLKDQLSTTTLDNRNLQLQVDNETALAEAKVPAEIQAVTTVNRDLTAQLDRVNADIREEKSKKGEAQRILDDLTNKHNNANQHFENLLEAANKDKAQAEQDLTALRGQV